MPSPCPPTPQPLLHQTFGEAGFSESGTPADRGADCNAQDKIAAEAIIESEWWTAACFSETNPVQNGVDQSCSNFRDLINSHPSLALKVQDRCLQYSSAESGLTHDFRLFEDNFCHEEGQITLEKPHALTAGERLLQNHPVSLMVQHTRAELLQHSLTDAWLLHLWRTYVSHIFTFLLIIEVLFLIALHIFIYNVE
ncbi:Transient receptor potential cation channel subfamily A member 1 [Chionoecetes opilio]|uniref:Transient receptor potential cation channel subfamily A member 1 n=1 Tax=Chionoecetes opilio TaxID=41210 RepID=A0A8J5CH77_CHIOP|nr:Transient receptor potential cation channel subfamily A member 1 [Chionoecetes opilio]